MNLIKSLFKGISQIFLQKSDLAGALILIAIFYSSWIVGLGTLLGVFIATMAAVLLKYDKEEIEDGLYGFNGALVGAAVFALFDITILVITLTIMGSILSSILMKQINQRIPAYTFPFVLSTWITILVMNRSGIIPSLFVPESISLNTISSLTMSFSQVVFVENMVAGILIFIAILTHSRKSAAYAFIGAMTGFATALMFSLPISLINLGILSYNSILCSLAFEQKKKIFYGIISMILSVLITFAMFSFNIAILTAPYVLSVWIILVILNAYQWSQELKIT